MWIRDLATGGPEMWSEGRVLSWGVTHPEFWYADFGFSILLGTREGSIRGVAAINDSSTVRQSTALSHGNFTALHKSRTPFSRPICRLRIECCVIFLGHGSARQRHSAVAASGVAPQMKVKVNRVRAFTAAVAAPAMVVSACDGVCATIPRFESSPSRSR